MKTIRMLPALGLVLTWFITSFAQVVESEVPGDNFSLEGALELFKKSSSPEEFEKMLNSPDTKVNNLDLNGDGYIDYMRVHDRYKGNVHAFILQAVISENEVQDVAVIELEKLSNGKAVLQIIGDEDVYGVETIIEPTSEVRTYAGTRTTQTVVNVWAWPSVQYVYGPYYTSWISPWGWYTRPVWYHPWRPVAYVHYYPVWRPYHHHYVACHTRRVVHAHHIYQPYRRTSIVVRDRHRDQIVRYRSERRDVRHNERDRYAGSRQRVEDANISRRRAETPDINRRPVTQQRQQDMVTSRTRSGAVRTAEPQTNLQRNSDALKRTEAQVRSNTTDPSARALPRENSTMNRTASPENSRVQQQVRRPAEVKRGEAPSTSAGSLERYRRQNTPASPPKVERRAAPENNARQHSAPRSNTVERRSSGARSDSGPKISRPERGRQ